MRFANLDDRLVVVHADETVTDAALASAGRFGPDPMSAFADWDAFAAWAAALPVSGDAPVDRERLGPPVPRPPQVFAIGINYREHADEAGYAPDSLPVTFTKFPSSLTGPSAAVVLPEGNVDWEVELVVVIGRSARQVMRDDAWSFVAGLTVGQDLSERVAQLEGARPQFSLAKSHPGFSPTGPWVVTPDELSDPGDLGISCAVNGETMQDSRTSRMIYDVPELIARLSAVVTLLPGDIVFSGTPAGIGNARTPKRFIGETDVLESSIEGIGTMTTRFVR